jgi:hypothetical protein
MLRKVSKVTLHPFNFALELWKALAFMKQSDKAIASCDLDIDA